MEITICELDDVDNSSDLFSHFQANGIGYNHWSDEATYGWQYIFASKGVQSNARFEIGRVDKPRTLYIKYKERECVRYFTFHHHEIGIKIEIGV